MRGFIATLSGIGLAIALPLAIFMTAVWITIPTVDFYEVALQKTNAYERTIQLADHQVELLYNTETQVLPSDIFTAPWLEAQIHTILSNTLPIVTTSEATLDDVTGVISLREPKSKATELLPQLIANQIPFAFDSTNSITDSTEGPDFMEESDFSFETIVNGIADEISLQDLLTELMSGGNVLTVIAPGLNQVETDDMKSNNVENPDGDDAGSDDTVQLVNDQLHIIQNSIRVGRNIMIISWVIVALLIGVILVVLRSWKSKFRGLAWCLLTPTVGMVTFGAGLWLGSSSIQGLIVPILELPSGWSTLLIEIAQNLVKQFALPILWMSVPLIVAVIAFFIFSLLMSKPKTS